MPSSTKSQNHSSIISSAFDFQYFFNKDTYNFNPSYVADDVCEDQSNRNQGMRGCFTPTGRGRGRGRGRDKSDKEKKGCFTPRSAKSEEFIPRNDIVSNLKPKNKCFSNYHDEPFTNDDGDVDSLGTPPQNKLGFWNELMALMKDDDAKVPHEITIEGVPRKKKLFNRPRVRRTKWGKKTYAPLA